MPAIVWGICAIACWQAIAVIGLRLVVRASDHRFDSSANKWLGAVVDCLFVFIVLVVAAFIALNVLGYTTPGVMLGLLAGGLVALIARELSEFSLGPSPQCGSIRAPDRSLIVGSFPGPLRMLADAANKTPIIKPDPARRRSSAVPQVLPDSSVDAFRVGRFPA
ncbi:DUF2975 domain-containing protein [Arthrobacter sp. UYCu712]|uniref:DUF2975 domain-containing protein n=1 Tax=Arthrobacter sp. UYCu712 TaxID=3156340 RepID=UPI0033954C70